MISRRVLNTVRLPVAPHMHDVPSVRFELTLSASLMQCLCQLGYKGICAPEEIRTLT